MADKKPLKQRDPNDPTVGLATFEPTDTVPIEHGGTSAVTATGARTNLDVYSKAESDGLTSGGQVDTVVGGVNVDVDATDPINPVVSVAQALFDAKADQADLDTTNQNVGQNTSNITANTIAIGDNNSDIADLEVDKENAFIKNTGFNKDFGNLANTVVEGNDPRLTSGQVDEVVGGTNVTVNDADPTKPIVNVAQSLFDAKEDAFAKNTAFNKNFGGLALDVCEGNDARLSNDRNPTPHTHVEANITDLDKYTQLEVDTKDAALQTNIDGKEPTISPKNTGFNKDLGTTAGTVSEGDHVHAAVAVTYVDTHLIGAVEVQDALDTLAVISGAGIISVSATITVGAGNSTVNGDLNATDFTGHEFAVGTALQIEPNYIVTFVYGSELYRWTGPNQALVGLGGTYTALLEDLFSLGSSDHNALTNRNAADQHNIASMTGLQGALDAKEPVISPKNTAFNKNFGSATGTVCEGDDARLSDARPPDPHTHVEADVTNLDKYTQLEVDTKDGVLQTNIDGKENAFSKNTGFNKNFGSTAGTVVEGNDARLTSGQVNSVVGGTNVTVNSADPINPIVSVAQALFDAKADQTDLDATDILVGDNQAAITINKNDITQNTSDIGDNASAILTKEPIISPKNSAFNKNFGAVAGTVTEGDDARLSDSRPPTAHTHVEVDITDLDKYTKQEIDDQNTLLGNDIGQNQSDIATNASDITDNANAILTKEPIIAPKNSAFNKNFGATTGTVCEGDDSRLSDNRDPNAHIHVITDVTDLDTELGSKVEDKGEWVQSHYDYNDQVSLDGYLVRCVNPAGTDDYPIPVNIGEKSYIYDAVEDVNETPLPRPVFTAANGGSNAIESGMLYTFGDAFQTLLLAINVPELSTSTNYKIHLVLDPFGTPTTRVIYDPFLVENEFQVIVASADIVQAGTQMLIYIEAYTTSTSATNDGTYRYLRSGTGAPGTGDVIRTDDFSRIRISATDSLGADQTAVLAGAQINDTFRIIQDSNVYNWETVKFDTTGTLIGSYYEFQCHLDDRGSTPGNNVTVSSTLTIFDAGNTLYNQDTDYFLNTNLEGKAQGYLKVGSAGYILNNDAYGVDIQIQRVTQSADWLIRASGAQGSSGDGDSGIVIVDNLDTQNPNQALSANMGYVLDQTKVSQEQLDHKRDKLAGIVGRGHSWLDFNYATGELTLIPNASEGLTEFTVWSYDEKYIKTNESIIVPKTDPRFIVYYDNTGELATVAIGTDNILEFELSENACIIARISVSMSDQIYTLVLDLRYDVHMDPATRNTFVKNTGVVYKSGLAIQNLTVDGSGDLPEHATFSIQDGSVYLADILYETSTRQQDLTFPAQIPVMYLYNTDWKLKATDDYPMIYEGSVGTDYTGTLMPYNTIDFNTGVGDLVEPLNNDMVCMHYFATNGLYDGIIAIQGQFTYLTKSNARTGALDEINRILTNSTAKTYFTPIGTVIYQTGTGRSNVPHAEVVSVSTDEDYVDLRLSKVALGAPTENTASSFHEDAFTVFDDRNQQLKFSLEYSDPALQQTMIWRTCARDLDFRVIPEYKLIIPAAGPLAVFDPISMDANGFAQKYPATGGESSSVYTTRNVTESAMRYASSNVGVVFYTTGNNVLYIKVGRAEANGSVTWGTEAQVTLNGNITVIESVFINSTRIAASFVNGGRLDTQVYDINIGGLAVSGGNVYNVRSSGVTCGGIGYNNQAHLLWGYNNGDTLYNQYATMSGTSLSFPYSERSMGSTSGPQIIQVVGSTNDVLIFVLGVNGQVICDESDWNKPTFGTGRYDDHNSGRTVISSGAQFIGGIEVKDNVVFCQAQLANNNWQSYNMSYSNGGSMDAPNNFGAEVVGKMAYLLNSASGIGYNISINANNNVEVRQGLEAQGIWNLIYTSSFQIVSATHKQGSVVMFESTWTMLLVGDTPSPSDTVYFINSNVARSDYYIGNAKTAVNQGEDVEVLIGLPIIAHSQEYSPGDFFELGPYKYQVITEHQVVIIIEETQFPAVAEVAQMPALTEDVTVGNKILHIVDGLIISTSDA